MNRPIIASAVYLLVALCVPTPVLANDWPDLSKSQARIGGGERDAAVIVAVEHYPFVAKVPGARQNASDWHLYFTQTLNMRPDRVALLRDNEATLEKMRKFTAAKAAEVEPGGTLWFIFIGHGAPSKDGRDGLLVGADAQQEADGMYARSLPRSELLALLAHGRQEKSVIIIDACFSGRTAAGEPLIAGLQPLIVSHNSLGSTDVRAILLTAAKADQFAGPLPKAGSMRPAFSYLALGALRGWAADETGKITAGRLISFTEGALKLAKDRTQTPELSAGSPDAVLAVGREASPDLASIDRAGGEQPSAKSRHETENTKTLPVAKGSILNDPAQRTTAPSLPRKTSGVEWITIPGGVFLMGSETGEPDEKPVHRVTISTFEMAKSEVTFKQYRACVDAGVCTQAHFADGTCWAFSSNPHRKSLPPSFLGDDQPAVCVDWHQARMFAEWVGGRLPTEAEWEYAARSGGRTRIYPWGNEEPSCARAVMADGCGRATTWPVCSKKKGNTQHGLCDMAGNVLEWVEDWYHGSRSGARSYVGAPSDGSAWAGSGENARVVRGGSWDGKANFLRTSFRGANDPGEIEGSLGPGGRDVTTGFRPVRQTR